MSEARRGHRCRLCAWLAWQSVRNMGQHEPSGRQSAGEPSCGLRIQRLQAIGDECHSGGPDGDQTCRLPRIVAVIRRSREGGVAALSAPGGRGPPGCDRYRLAGGRGGVVLHVPVSDVNVLGIAGRPVGVAHVRPTLLQDAVLVQSVIVQALRCGVEHVAGAVGDGESYGSVDLRALAAGRTGGGVFLGLRGVTVCRPGDVWIGGALGIVDHRRAVGQRDVTERQTLNKLSRLGHRCHQGRATADGGG
jgi:hypothetical protein